jgi:hypothetical protein
MRLQAEGINHLLLQNRDMIHVVVRG